VVSVVQVGKIEDLLKAFSASSSEFHEFAPNRVTLALMQRSEETECVTRLSHYVLDHHPFYPERGEISLVQPMLDDLNVALRLRVANCLATNDFMAGKGWTHKLEKVNELRKPTLPYDEFNNRTPDNDLAEAKGLFAEFSRRANYRLRQELNSETISHLNQPSKIRALIDALDEVIEVQPSFPGSIEFCSNNIVRELLAEGKVAVPALIDVIENDDRYTQSVSMGRPWFSDRGFHSVRSVAWEILDRLWPRRPITKGLEKKAAAKLLRKTF
jgi:hypothetical protein